jgi:hypothetical protein
VTQRRHSDRAMKLLCSEGERCRHQAEHNCASRQHVRLLARYLSSATSSTPQRNNTTIYLHSKELKGEPELMFRMEWNKAALGPTIACPGRWNRWVLNLRRGRAGNSEDLARLGHVTVPPCKAWQEDCSRLSEGRPVLRSTV